MSAHDALLVVSPLLIAVAAVVVLAIPMPKRAAETKTPKPLYCQHKTSTMICRRIQHPACRSGLCARCCAALDCGCMVVDQPVPEGTR